MVGGAIAIAMMVFFYSIDKKSTAEESGRGWRPAVSSARDKHLARLRQSAELVFMSSMVPLLFSLHRGDHVTRSGRHFEFLMVLTATGMLALSGVVFGIWWVLSGFMVRHQPGSPAAD